MTAADAFDRALHHWQLRQDVLTAGPCLMVAVVLLAMSGGAAVAVDHALKQLDVLFRAVNNAYAGGVNDEGRELWEMLP